MGRVTTDKSHMGKKLEEIYIEVGKVGGLEARMRLAAATCIPSAKAKELPDTPENIEKFREAVKKILSDAEYKELVKKGLFVI